MKSKTYFVLVFSFSLFGCANSIVANDEGQTEEKVYVTGSKLPQKKSPNKTATISKEDVETAQRSIAR